jgi:hypothetical protein
MTIDTGTLVVDIYDTAAKKLVLLKRPSIRKAGRNKCKKQFRDC